jgi:hypothetical protein
MNNFSAAAVLDRLQLAAGVSSDSALSRELGVNRATLGNWRNRDSVPYSICVAFAIKHGISLNWLLAGQGARSVDDRITETSAPSDQDANLSALFSELNPDQQKEVLQMLIDKKRLNHLEAAVRGLQQLINLNSTIV